MDTLEHQAQSLPAPTPDRPLLGLTALVIEDSRFACEAMRLLCLRSGARIRRADSLRAARRHLQVYRPSIVIADLGLPDGNGIDLIAELARAQPRVDALLAISGDTHLAADALAAGADRFMSKPLQSLSQFQQVVLAALPPHHRPPGLSALSDDTVRPDDIALQDDMAHMDDVLTGPCTPETLDYVAQFLAGVARSAQDAALEQAATALAARRAMGLPTNEEKRVIRSVLRQRLTRQIAI
ncbi:response regulator [Sulfitobacter litoralis]|jgi:CheY-like chemotaxis protein|uniref:response regulator n=1 Tax=Sulfitobacter litoralis TaxID=335975 RepID=UPI002B26C335|nr:response regulator [Sulfitobacter litoralis]